MAETVKVRIAVAVRPNGTWFAYGEDHVQDTTLRQVVDKPNAEPYWLTAELPIPNVTDVEASVEVDGGT